MTIFKKIPVDQEDDFFESIKKFKEKELTEEDIVARFKFLSPAPWNRPQPAIIAEPQEIGRREYHITHISWDDEEPDLDCHFVFIAHWPVYNKHLPLHPMPKILNSTAPQKYEIRNKSPNVRAMYAVTDIEPGEIILVERPFFIFGQDTPSQVLMGMFEDAWGAMSQADKKLIWNLPKTIRTSGDPWEVSMLNTNGIGIDLKPEHKWPGWTKEDDVHSAICPIASLIDHSCGPNASTLFDQKLFCMIISAARQIRQGEEITISFVRVFGSREERNELMKSTRRAETGCTCDYCSLSPAGIAESDSRRARLDEIRDTCLLIRDFLGDPRQNAQLFHQQTLEQLSIITKEGLEVWLLGEIAERMALYYAALEEKKLFKQWLWVSYLANQRDPRMSKDLLRRRLLALETPRLYVSWGFLNPLFDGRRR